MSDPGWQDIQLKEDGDSPQYRMMKDRILVVEIVLVAVAKADLVAQASQIRGSAKEKVRAVRITWLS